MKNEAIAKVCHQANKAYCEGIGDFSQDIWERTDAEIQASAIDGVIYRADNPEVTAEGMHNNWMAFKKAAGWRLGEVKSDHYKTHPCMVPYDELPEEQKAKDAIFSAICAILLPKQEAEPEIKFPKRSK